MRNSDDQFIEDQTAFFFILFVFLVLINL